MNDEIKTKAQPIDELATLPRSVAQMHQRLHELETLETERQRIEKLYAVETGVTSLSVALSEPQQKYSSNPSPQRDTSKYFLFPKHPQLGEIFAFVEANYHQSISLNEVARSFNYTPSYLTSLVRRLTGQTLYQWIVQRRMFESRRLLLTTNLSVHKIAEKVGYLDTGHFVKHFAQIHKNPPKTWRDNQYQLTVIPVGAGSPTIFA